MFSNFTSRLMSPLSKDETGHGSSYFTWNSPDKPSWLSGRHYGSGTPPPLIFWELVLSEPASQRQWLYIAEARADHVVKPQISAPGLWHVGSGQHETANASKTSRQQCRAFQHLTNFHSISFEVSKPFIARNIALEKMQDIKTALSWWERLVTQL